MSRHRIAVTTALQKIRPAAADELSIDMLQHAFSEDRTHVLADLMSPSTRTVETFKAAISAARREFGDTSTGSVENAELALDVRFSARVAVCAVDGRIPVPQTRVVATTTIKVLLRTRWLHMWDESEHRLEWPENAL